MAFQLTRHDTQVSQDAITHHYSRLGPKKSAYESNEPMVEPMTDYTSPKKRAPTAGENEDRVWASQGSGRSIVEAEETYYD